MCGASLGSDSSADQDSSTASKSWRNREAVLAPLGERRASECGATVLVCEVWQISDSGYSPICQCYLVTGTSIRHWCNSNTAKIRYPIQLPLPGKQLNRYCMCSGKYVDRRIELACEWCLDQHNHQGWFGEAFINVLAAAAGLQIAWPHPDCTGIDCHISSTREVERDFPLMSVQVKSWSVPVLTRDDGFWRYRGLTEKRFNALAGQGRRVPRYLFLVVVPPDIGKYSKANDECLLLRQAAYWVSLADVEQIPEPRCERKVQVMVPTGNLLTVESLTKLCEEP